MRIEITGDKALRAALKAAGRDLTRDMRRLISRAAFGVDRFSKQEAPVLMGALRAEIHTTVAPSGLEAEVKSGQTLGYPVHVHEGHRTASGSTVAGNPYMLRGLARQKLATRRDLEQLAKSL